LYSYPDLSVFWYDGKINIICDYVAEAIWGDDGEDHELALHKANFKEILDVWEFIDHKPTLYLVITQDDKGWVKIEGKEQLSEQDLKAIQEDVDYFGKFEKK